MAVNVKDIERLWNQYSEEGVQRGISVAQFFESNGVPYRTFENDGVKTVSETAENRREVYVSYVNIGLSNGVRIEHHRLSYGELVCFINKLQSLCSA